MNRILILCFISFLSTSGFGQTFLSVEGNLAWQGRNDQRVPGEGGTEFSIAELKRGPFLAYRVYVGHVWNNRHEIRALYAPLALEIDGRLNRPVNFLGTTFAADTNTNFFYKFNSYRLTYAYHFQKWGDWNLALGFTGKIRDAEVRLTQGSLRESKQNVGFVPLLNFQALREFDDRWRFRFDFDGLAAPQGRAFDIGVFGECMLSQQWFYFAGYRMIEGGADNKEVYNFAWFHSAAFGLRGEFN
jgi:hypothetical protein